MQIVGTHHVALYTTNLAAVQQFYTETLGLPVIGRIPGRAIVFIDAGGTVLELVAQEEGKPGGPLGWAHLALEVADVDAACRELGERGVSFHIPPTDFPAEAPAMRLAFCKDPDGNDVELLTPLGARYPQ